MKTRKVWTAQQKLLVDKFKKSYDSFLKRIYKRDTPLILRELRQKHKLSQEQLSSVLGISKYTLAHYENGKSKIPSDFIVKISCLYSISADLLLGLDDSEISKE